MIRGPELTQVDKMIWAGDYVHLAAEQVPLQPAIIAPEMNVSISYQELRRRIDRAQVILADAGLQAGDRLAYLGKNSDIYYVLLIAAIRSGIVMVPINWRCVVPEIAFFLEDSQPKLLLCDPEFETTAIGALRENPNPPRVLKTERAGEHDPDIRSMLEEETDFQPGKVAWDSDAVCLHLYTSGTTGRPKGTLCRHFALSIMRHQERQFAEFADWEGGTIIAAMPHFHIGGLSWMVMGLLRGSTCVLTRDASAPNLVHLIQEFRADSIFVVPSVVRAIVDEVRSRNIALPSLRRIYYGAAPIGQKLLGDAMTSLGCEFGQFFGMTEVTGSATFLGPQFHDLARPQLMQSVGRPFPGIAIDIRDAEGRSLPPEKRGEIWIEAPSLMHGYWRRPDATSEVLKDGWYRTGDGGYLDEEGFLYLTDRIKDMIVTGGENVYPGEVEEALRRHPAVLDAAVVGKPDERWGEAVVAVVECRAGQVIAAPELSAFVRQQLAAFKCPKMIDLVDALPRTASGKVQRAVARAQFLQRHSV